MYSAACLFFGKIWLMISGMLILSTSGEARVILVRSGLSQEIVASKYSAVILYLLVSPVF
jgi:hypothetical protein